VRNSCLGKRLFVNGEQVPFLGNDLKYFYDQAKPINLNLTEVLSDNNGQFLELLLSQFCFSSPSAHQLIAGWIYTAVIAGCLPWRTHIWLTGSAGSGKSTLLDSVIAKILDERIAIKIMGGVTEAGIRAYIGNRNLSIIYDESEPEGKSAKARNDAILFLCRISSSNDGGKILKGTPNQEAIQFELRSQFCFSSTMVSLDATPDKERFVVIPLSIDKQDDQKYSCLLGLLEHIDNNFTNGLITRAIKNVETTKDNFYNFSKLIARKIKSKRWADNFANLLAGHQALLHTRKLTEPEIENIIKDFPFDDFMEDKQYNQEREILAEIMQVELKMDLNSRSLTYTIGQWIKESLFNDSEFTVSDKKEIEKILLTKGIKVSIVESCIYIAYNSKFLNQKLSNTKFTARYYMLLSRNPGAKKAGTKRFGPGIGKNGVDNAIKINLELILGPDWQKGD
jgi:putative DNA primase/helicase